MNGHSKAVEVPARIPSQMWLTRDRTTNSIVAPIESDSITVGGAKVETEEEDEPTILCVLMTNHKITALVIDAEL